MRQASIEYTAFVTWRMTWINYLMFVKKESPTINGEVRRTLPIWISNIRRWHKVTLQWRHNERNCVSNHQPHDCLLNRLFRRRSKKNQSPASLALLGEFTGDRWITTQRASNAEMFPFDDVIMKIRQYENWWKTLLQFWFHGVSFSKLCSVKYHDHRHREIVVCKVC